MVTGGRYLVKISILTDGAHRVITSMADTAIDIQLRDKGLRDKVVSSRKRLERYGSAAIVAPRSFRPSEMGVSIIKELAANPGLVFGVNGIGFRPESHREMRNSTQNASIANRQGNYSGRVRVSV